uniref:Adipokinetic hormone/corazonin-related peptide n=1 Tax=Callinectes toxotes TaxID=375461 RepID=A0A7T1L7B9_9EUCA|nr:adipokinetic hormone/corazonin-related peptide [Callinectes toxotes]
MASWMLTALMVSCVLVGSVTPQITFSRSWVPQGKRSPSPSDIPEPLDACRDARAATLTSLAGHLLDMMNDLAAADHRPLPDDGTTSLRLRNAMMDRRRHVA